MRKGIVFTLDAIIALLIILLLLTGFLFLREKSMRPEIKYERINYLAKDVSRILSELKIGEAKNFPTIKKLIEDDVITEKDLNSTLLDLIGSFWSSGNYTLARNITKEIFEIFDECMRLDIENETVFSSCNESGESMAVNSIIESGYEIGKPIYGYIARASLAGIRRKVTSAFLYFGGYVGEGNLTFVLSLPSFDSIEEGYLELGAGNNFTLWINGNFAGEYQKGSAGGGELRADKFILCNSTFNPNICSFFKEGNNTIEVKFSSNESNYIGGGFLRVTYNTTEMKGSELTNFYRFPGITGLLNLYSSFYIPGYLNTMEIYLHYKNNYTTFLTIGNTEVFRNNESGEQKIHISNETLSSLLNYTSLSKKTIPIRLGTESSILQKVGNADVILITDVSGSMRWKLNDSSTGIERDCDDPNLYEGDTQRISLAKCLDKEFVGIILNTSGNRVGLIAYSGEDNNIPTLDVTIIQSYHNLTTDKNALIAQIDNYNPSGATGICGAIRKAILMLKEQSNASRKKYIIVMTDGLPNVQCNPEDEDDLQGCIPCQCSYPYLRKIWSWLFCTSNPSYPYPCSGDGCLYLSCNDYVSERAKEDSINASCRAREELNATVYSIGFGPISNCPIANSTLHEIAACGNGKYYSSMNATELKEIYREIAEEIVNISYTAQKILVKGNISRENVLYPDSYIYFNYTPLVKPYEYGEFSLTLNTKRFKEFSGDSIDIPYKIGWINISEGIKVSDLKVTSYSSDYWTDRVYLKNSTGEWIRVFWLSDFGSNYAKLGDPFIVQVPIDLLTKGNNSIGVGTGISAENATGGSPDDRIIFTIRIKGLVGYGNVFETRKEAEADAKSRLIQKLNETLGEFRDYVEIDYDKDIYIDPRVIQGIRWMYGPSLFKLIAWEKF